MNWIIILTIINIIAFIVTVSNIILKFISRYLYSKRNKTTQCEWCGAILLSKEAKEKFWEALNNPPEPNEKLKELMKKVNK